MGRKKLYSEDRKGTVMECKADGCTKLVCALCFEKCFALAFGNCCSRACFSRVKEKNADHLQKSMAARRKQNARRNQEVHVIVPDMDLLRKPIGPVETPEENPFLFTHDLNLGVPTSYGNPTCTGTAGQGESHSHPEFNPRTGKIPEHVPQGEPGSSGGYNAITGQKSGRQAQGERDFHDGLDASTGKRISTLRTNRVKGSSPPGTSQVKRSSPVPPGRQRSQSVYQFPKPSTTRSRSWSTGNAKPLRPVYKRGSMTYKSRFGQELERQFKDPAVFYKDWKPLDGEVLAVDGIYRKYNWVDGIGKKWDYHLLTMKEQRELGIKNEPELVAKFRDPQ